MNLKETIFYINNKYNIKDLTTLTQDEVQEIINFAFDRGVDSILEGNTPELESRKFTLSNLHSGKS